MKNFLMLPQVVPIINTLLQVVSNEAIETAEIDFFEEFSDVHSHIHNNNNNNITRMFDTSYTIFKLKSQPSCTRYTFSRR